jgi:hypothetical protein
MHIQVSQMRILAILSEFHLNPSMVQMRNLALLETKRITVYDMDAMHPKPVLSCGGPLFFNPPITSRTLASNNL